MAPDRLKRLRFGSFVISFLLLAGCGLTIDNDERLDRAAQAVADGDFRSAIIDAKDVLRREPDNRRGRRLLGEASLEAGDGPAAEKELRAAIELGEASEQLAVPLARAMLLQGKFQQVLDEIPANVDPAMQVELNLARADAMMGVGEFAAARALFMAVLGSQPDSLDAEMGIVSSHIADGNQAQAQSSLSHVLETYGGEARVWLFSGAFNADGGNLQRAVDNFQAALRLSEEASDTGDILRALGGLGDVYLSLDRIDDARPVIARFSELAGDTPQGLMLNARLAYADEEWSTVEQNLLQILKVAPDYRPAQMLLGAAHLNSGNVAQAEMYLSAAVAAEPTDRIARQMLAQAQLQLRRANEAQEILAPLVQGSDADARSMQLAIQASLANRDVNSAIAYLRQSLEREPDNVNLRLQLAVVLIEAARTDEAQDLLNSIGETDSLDTAYRRDSLEVVRMLRDDEIDQALRGARRLVEAHPKNPGAFNLLGSIHRNRSDDQLAAAAFDQALSLDPENAVALGFRARLDEASGDPDAALVRYAAVLAEDSGAAWAAAAMGGILGRQGDHTEAAGHFATAVDIEPMNTDYRLNLAKALYNSEGTAAALAVLAERQDLTESHLPSGLMLTMLIAESGKYREAELIARRLQLSHPQNPEAFALEGEIHLANERIDNAIKAYEKALNVEPQPRHAVRLYLLKKDTDADDTAQPLADYLKARPLDADVRIVLAQHYMQAGDSAGAAVEYARVVDQTPNNVIALNNLAWTYYLQGDARAADFAREAYALRPDLDAVVDTLGWILVEQGNIEEGESLLRQAVSLSNGRAGVRYHHAVALARLGKQVEARQILQEILASGEAFSDRDDAEELLTSL